MVERIDIERALDELISNEESMRFQGLAVALAQWRSRELIACERHKDLGLDAYSFGKTRVRLDGRLDVVISFFRFKLTATCNERLREPCPKNQSEGRP